MATWSSEQRGASGGLFALGTVPANVLKVSQPTPTESQGSQRGTPVDIDLIRRNAEKMSAGAEQRSWNAKTTPTGGRLTCHKRRSAAQRCTLTPQRRNRNEKTHKRGEHNYRLDWEVHGNLTTAPGNHPWCRNIITENQAALRGGEKSYRDPKHEKNTKKNK